MARGRHTGHCSARSVHATHDLSAGSARVAWEDSGRCVLCWEQLWTLNSSTGQTVWAQTLVAWPCFPDTLSSQPRVKYAQQDWVQITRETSRCLCSEAESGRVDTAQDGRRGSQPLTAKVFLLVRWSAVPASGPSCSQSRFSRNLP